MLWLQNLVLTDFYFFFFFCNQLQHIFDDADKHCGPQEQNCAHQPNPKYVIPSNSPADSQAVNQDTLVHPLQTTATWARWQISPTIAFEFLLKLIYSYH